MFRLKGSPWFLYDGLDSKHVKLIGRPHISDGEKLGFIVYVQESLLTSTLTETQQQKDHSEEVVDIDKEMDEFYRKEKIDEQEERELLLRNQLEKEEKTKLQNFDQKIDKKHFKGFLMAHFKKICEIMKTAKKTETYF